MSDRTYDMEISVRTRRLVSVHDFRVGNGRMTVLLGESGIGKTLIARALYGLLDPEEYTIRINGVRYSNYLADPSLRALRKESFLVFQEPSSHLNPVITIRQQLQEGDLSRGPDPAQTLQELWRGGASRDIAGLLELYPRPYRPSGGEKQRVLLAMALRKLDIVRAAAGPLDDALYIFDEPTGSLDNRYRDLFLDLLLRRFRSTPVTLLFITHDYSLIRHLTTVHRDLIPRIDFRELAADGGRLVVRDFRAASYSTWLDSLETGRQVAGPKPAAPPLLTLESKLTLFGRRLMVTHDRDGNLPASLQVWPGRLTYLKAPSGTGKTSLARAVMGLLPVDAMEARLGDLSLNASTSRRTWQRKVWGKRMTMVFQHADEALNMHSTAEQTLRRLPVSNGASRDSIKATLGQLFDTATVPQILRKKIWMLSGGQKQRLNLLRGLVLAAGVLILDEPLNGLDFDSCMKVIDLLSRSLKEGRGILVISHNEEIFDAVSAGEDRYYLHAR